MQRVLGQLTVLAALIVGVSMQSKGFYESCTQKEDCLDDFLCLSSRCVCADNQIVAADRLQCLGVISYGEPCRETGQCLLELNDTFCGKSNKCECAPGFGYNSNDSSCSIIVDNVVAHGGKCRLDRQCKTGMICEGQICECKPGLHWDRAAHSCLVNVVTRAPGTCSTDNDCLQYSNTVCRSGECNCRNGYWPATDGRYCKEVPRAPGTCTINSHCLQYINTECKNGVCSCKTGYWPATDGGHYCKEAPRNPVVTRTPGTCSYDQHCQQFQYTTCVNGNCVCKRGFRFTQDPQRGYYCSAGAGLSSVVTAMLLSLLLSKAAS